MLEDIRQERIAFLLAVAAAACPLPDGVVLRDDLAEVDGRVLVQVVAGDALRTSSGQDMRVPLSSTTGFPQTN